MVDLEEFAVTGLFGGLGSGATESEVMGELGAAEYREKGKKAGRFTFLYGDIELWFDDNRLERVSLRLNENEPPNGGPLSLAGFWPRTKRSMEYVRRLLAQRDVTWNLDELMSGLSREETSQTWVTERNVHLAFFEGELQGIATGFPDAAPGTS